MNDAEIQALGALDALRRRRYPQSIDLVQPTALGNILAAIDQRTQGAHGLDLAVAWPRLYPVLEAPMRAAVDDRRDILDALGRLCVTSAFLVPLASLLLIRSGWWLLLVLTPAAIGRFAYLGTLQAALSLGESIDAAVDLHRFDLLRALHLSLPENPDAERQLNRQLCDSWRQGAPFDTKYDHDATRPSN
jgi:hypothetical protein